MSRSGGKVSLHGTAIHPRRLILLRPLLLRPRSIVANYALSFRFTEIVMTTNLEVLEAEALKLSPSDRSHLLERLIASLDADPEVEVAWAKEADLRQAELDSGAVTAVSGDEAVARLRARLAR